MRNSFKALVLVAVGLLAASDPLLAHHGKASYDNDKRVTVSGVVTEWIWANPHCFLKLDVKDDKGGVQHWLLEASNPPDQTRQGWAKNSFKPGDEVSASVMVAKNGDPIGRFEGGGKTEITLNGKPFPPGSSDPANVQATPPKQ